MLAALLLLGGAEASAAPGKTQHVLVVTRTSELAAETGMSGDEIRKLLEPVGDILDLSAQGDITGVWMKATSQCEHQLEQNPGYYTAVQIVGGDYVVPMAEYKNPAWDAGLETSDPFILSDDLYGDVNGDQDAELPVARLPITKGMSKDAAAALLKARFSVLAVAPQEHNADFAYFLKGSSGSFIGDHVVSLMANVSRYTCPPQTYPDKPVAYDDAFDISFFLLHGGIPDTQHWWGDPGGFLGMTQPIAFDASQAKSSGVVLSGACYGAWTAERSYTKTLEPSGNEETVDLRGKQDANNSIALAFVSKGAYAFVGSTGVNIGPAADTPSVLWQFGALSHNFVTALSSHDSLEAFRIAKRVTEVTADGDACQQKVAREFVYYGVVPVSYWKTPPSAAPPATTSPAQPQDPVVWNDLDAAKKRAAAEGKKVIIDFWANWCPWCTKMDESFADPAVKAEVQDHFIIARIDIDKEPGLESQFGVSAVPTEIVITSDGTRLGSYTGYMDASTLLQTLTRAE